MGPRSTATLSRSPPAKRRTVQRIAAGLLLLAAGAGACGLLAAACRPRWYVPAAIDMRRLETDKDALARLVDEISAALNGGRSIEFEVADTQLNRWIAARHEVWPGEDWLRLGRLELPFLRFEAGAVRVAAVVRSHGWGCTVSAAVNVDTSPEEVTARLRSVAVGRLPVPIAVVDGLFRSAFREAARDRVLPHDASLPIRNEFTWPNGKRRFRVEGLHFKRGSAIVRLAPL